MWQDLTAGLPWPITVLLAAMAAVGGHLVKPLQERFSAARADDYGKQGWARAAVLENLLKLADEALDRGLIRENAAVRVIDLLLVLAEDLKADFASDPIVVARIERTSCRARDILIETRRHRLDAGKAE